MTEAQAQTGTENSAANVAAANAAGTTQGNQQQQQNQNQAQGQQQNGGQQANGTQNGADKTVASGANGQQQQQEKPYWPEDWREKMAEHYSAGDKKAYEKELKRLQSLDNPLSVYGSFRSIENTWSSRNFIKLPPKENAKPEDIAEYHKAIGVPEKPEGYLEALKLNNGAVLGEADKPVLLDLSAKLHKVGATPAVVNEIANWYYEKQEQSAAQLDEQDDKYRIESERALKEELGPAFKRKIGSTAPLFSAAAGGVDIENEKSLRARLLGGRMADGTIIGNDPDFNRWLIGLAQEVNPAGSVVEDGDQSGKSVDDELAEISKLRRTDRKAYNKNTALQARERELLAAKSKVQARQRA